MQTSDDLNKAIESYIWKNHARPVWIGIGTAILIRLFLSL
jgi:hypothetical protein